MNNVFQRRYTMLNKISIYLAYIKKEITMNLLKNIQHTSVHRVNCANRTIRV